MKRIVLSLTGWAFLALAAGCDEAMLNGLPSDVQAALSGLTLKPAFAGQVPETGDQDQTRDRVQLRLMDGSCSGDRLQDRHVYGSDGPGGGTGDPQRLRDGSCGD